MGRSEFEIKCRPVGYNLHGRLACVNCRGTWKDVGVSKQSERRLLLYYTLAPAASLLKSWDEMSLEVKLEILHRPTICSSKTPCVRMRSLRWAADDIVNGVAHLSMKVQMLNLGAFSLNCYFYSMESKDLSAEKSVSAF